VTHALPPALIFSVSYLGDLVTAALTLDIIARPPRPPAEVLTTPACAALFEGDDRVRGVRAPASLGAIGWRLAATRELLAARRRGFEVVNLEVYPPRWGYVRWLARYLGLTARSLDLPGLLSDNRRSAEGRPPLLVHRSAYYTQSVGGGGPASPALRVAESERQAVRQRIGPRLGSGRWCIAHPGSSTPSRRPDPHHLASVLGGLGNVSVVLVGVGHESDLTAAVAANLPQGVRVFDACGQLTLRELMAAIDIADLFVGGDSGPLKLAEGLGTPTLSFWTPGAPSAGFAGPLGRRHATLPAATAVAIACSAGRDLLDEAS